MTRKNSTGPVAETLAEPLDQAPPNLAVGDPTLEVEAATPGPEAPAPELPAHTPPEPPVVASDVTLLPSAAQDRTAPSPAKDAIMDTFETATEKTHAMFAGLNDRTKGAIEKSTHMLEELSAFGKGNIEAIVESSKIAAKALETVGQDVADYAKTSFESSTAAMKTLASASSPTEYFRLQSDYARTAFDAVVAQSSHATEKMLKLAGEIAQPISNRVAVATEKSHGAA
ncbi:phasin family protein [Sphingomonas sp. PB2P19]|uniref:phasin family protein n=1 Tax=Sphingomonas rhamnosi TaxID=3096156 RepID=UPI002FCC883B